MQKQKSKTEKTQRTNQQQTKTKILQGMHQDRSKEYQVK